MARRLLDGALRGATVTRADCDDRVLLRPETPGALAKQLVGRKVRAVERRGKWVRVVLDDGGRLFSHLGMTGGWLVAKVDDPPARFERARFDLTKGRARRSLRYLDSRRFGRLIAAPDDIASWCELGPDPMEGGLDPSTLAATLARSRRPVKDALMDQTFLAGIGNILATEGLWNARIDPRSPSNLLDAKDVGNLVRGLRKAIDKQLTAREKADGGEPDDDFAAYGRVGKPCRRCRTLLSRIVLGGRTTTFCGHCQMRRGSKPT
jgi:formamidopyrimidine-DNA glycosylase